MIGYVSRKMSTLTSPRVLASSGDLSRRNRPCPDFSRRNATTRQTVDSVGRMKKAPPSKGKLDIVVAGTLLENEFMLTTKSAPMAPDTTTMVTTSTTTMANSASEALSRKITCNEKISPTEMLEEKSTPVCHFEKTTPRTHTEISVPTEATRESTDTCTLTSLSTVVGAAVTTTGTTEKSDTELPCPHKTDDIDTELPRPHKIDVDVTKAILEAAVPGSLVQHFIHEHLVCKIHMGFFHILAHIPRTLTCGHTFCEPCLRNVVLGEAVIVCPVCGKLTGLPPGGVNGLPEDFYTASLCVRVIDLLEENSVKLQADIPCIAAQSENVSFTTFNVPENPECEYSNYEVDSFVVIDEVPPEQNPSDGQAGPATGGDNTPWLTTIDGVQTNSEAKQPTRTSTKRRKRGRKKRSGSLASLLDKFVGDVDGHMKIGTQNHVIDSFNMPWV
ncbi:PREDICTED: uncharacterized protein LOC109475766 [Branchiostoma belcheri]|uniref:Uncharacterized protein LOC109475766 n=1 Tax=Branchiostoma belcheri TaxID=7741 RepID=A0A6P4YRL5_BRABE|nr:PREDICTED: uncharacterized protein LOC109475766 [Branchiostoma belcheri]